MIKTKNDFKIINCPNRIFSKITKHDPSDFNNFIIDDSESVGVEVDESPYPVWFIKTQKSGSDIAEFKDLDDTEMNLKIPIVIIFSLFKIPEPIKKYYIFHQTASDPDIDGYIDQWRIVSDYAMKNAFQINPDKDKLIPNQPANVYDFLYELMAQEKENRKNNSHPKLIFNFVIENESFGIYRIWSDFLNTN